MGGAYANMFTLKFGLASPLEEMCTAPAPGVAAGEGGCGSSRRRVSSFCAPFIRNIYGIRRGGLTPDESHREAPGPEHCVCIGLWKSHFANFLPSPCTKECDLWEAREWRVRMQVPGSTKQSGKSTCVLCTSGEAGEPAQHPSGRLRDSRETEAEESRSGIFQEYVWGTINRGRGWGMLGLPSLLKVSFPDLIDF